MPKPKSQAQAHLLGLIAGGMSPNKDIHISKEHAKDLLRGVKVKALPKKKGKKK